MDQENRTFLYYLMIFSLAALLFFPFLGRVNLFDWDEVNFAESAREMIVSRDYLTVQINFKPFWEKPPLFIWMQAVSMKLFGINEFAARFPNAVCGVVTLLVIFALGKRLFDIRFGLLWVLSYAGSMLPFFYFKSGIIDPWFNLFTFLGIVCFADYLIRPVRNIWVLITSAVFLGLAILTKGPAALLIFLLTAGIYLVIHKFKVMISVREVAVFLIFFLLTGGFWFILQILKGNFDIIREFIVYQIKLFRTEDAGHGGFFFYHFVVLLAGVFPASVLSLPALFGMNLQTGIRQHIKTWMVILFWTVLILFTIVNTKIIHYSSLAYFPLTFLAAWSIYHLLDMNSAWKKVIYWFTLVLGLLIAVSISGLTFIESYKGYLIRHEIIHDPFAVACLKPDVNWGGYEFIPAMVLFAGLMVYACCWKFRKGLIGAIVLFILNAVTMFASMFMIVPKVEQYSQHALVEFFKTVDKEDVYLGTLGFKSYAYLFYGKAKLHNNPNSGSITWLLTGKIDKEAYFAMKIKNRDRFFSQYPDLIPLYEKNGYVFCKRKPVLDK
jgi:4-amino-4-deoxy-L-arabinose transferase-like glycosyltransferase